MAFYVDGFVIPVPRRKVAAYRSLARKTAHVFIEYGALQVVEAMGDDVKPGKHTSFPQSVKLKPGEVVFFSWITYRSRRHRDAVNSKVIADPRLASMMAGKNMPFDMRRMIYGGFKTVVHMGEG
jgi:uncharacterized protein YbaA (DUF1428 family)